MSTHGHCTLDRLPRAGSAFWGLRRRASDSTGAALVGWRHVHPRRASATALHAARPGGDGPRPRHAHDGAVCGDQGGQPGLPPVLPNGRFLRAVLRGRRDRQPGARHRADQARQAPGSRHPHVRRADRARRRLPAAAHRAGSSRGGMRADRGPRGSAQARSQVGGQARRRAARHPRHHHRGTAAGARPRQHPSCPRPRALVRRGLDLWPRRRGHFHGRVHAHGNQRRGNSRRNRAHRAVRDRGAGRDPRRQPGAARAGRIPRAHRAGGRGAFGGQRRTAPHGFLRRAHARWIWRAHARRDRRGVAGCRLYRAHADRRAPAPAPARAPGARRDDGNRRGHARQSRTDAHAERGARGLAARLHRSHGDVGWRADARRAAGGAADGRRANRQRASTLFSISSTRRNCASGFARG